MIQANELRIGNWVNYLSERGGPKRIIMIKHDFANVLGKVDSPTFSVGYDQDIMFESCGAGMIEGIPVTEEWLLKFGFDPPNENLTDFYHDGWQFIICGKHFVLMDQEYNDIIKIEFVHQLQNLYFALTGTELTLKAGS